MNTHEQDYIIDHVGAENWDAVIEAFEGGTLAEIKSTLDDMFPSDDNSELAEKIYNELRNATI